MMAHLLVKHVIRRVVSSRFSLDQAAIATIVAGSAVWVYSAYQEGAFPLTKQCHSSKCRSSSSVDNNSITKKHHHHGYDTTTVTTTATPNRLQLSPRQCRQLEQQGFLVIDDFLTPTEVRRAARCAHRIEARRKKDQKMLLDNNTTAAPVAARFVGIRTDCMCFMDANYVGATETVPNEKIDRDHHDCQQQHEEEEEDDDQALFHVRNLLRSVADSIATSNFAGFQDGGYYNAASSSSAASTTTMTRLFRRLDSSCNNNNNNNNTKINESNHHPDARITTTTAATTTTTTTPLNRYQSPSSWIGVPETIQLSSYHALNRVSDDDDDDDDDNENSDSSSSTTPRKSNYNHAHRDGMPDGDWWNNSTDMGLIGHLRSLYLRKRYITGIVYINETDSHNGSDLEQQVENDDDHVDSDAAAACNKRKNRKNTGPWMQTDGGYLRLFLGADMDDMTGDSCIASSSRQDDNKNNPENGSPLEKRIVDLAPKGGRLVLLSSEHVLHAVMPSFRHRVACTIWLTLNQ
jgi:hypothetical protein